MKPRTQRSCRCSEPGLPERPKPGRSRATPARALEEREPGSELGHAVQVQRASRAPTAAGTSALAPEDRQRLARARSRSGRRPRASSEDVAARPGGYGEAMAAEVPETRAAPRLEPPVARAGPRIRARLREVYGIPLMRRTATRSPSWC